MTLRPIQLEALDQALKADGLIGALPVGTGKTLVAFLLPTVLKAARPVFITKSALIPQAKRMLAQYREYWRIAENLEIISYEMLSSQKNADILVWLNPDLLIHDEAHCVAGRSVRTKRHRKFLKNNPGVKCVFMSGSLISRSIKDIAPLASLALGAQSPYPRDYVTLEEWSEALDPGQFREPGVLKELGDYGNWVFNSIGVVGGNNGDSISASLVFKPFKPPCHKEIARLLKKQNETWETPDGEFITDALTKWRRDGELSCGFYYKTVWPNNESEELRQAWTEARKQWNIEVSNKLKWGAESGMDSPDLLKQAAMAGRWDSKMWSEWSRLQSLCSPKQSTIWVTDSYLKDIKLWANDHIHSVIWYESRAFGERLAAEIPGCLHLKAGQDNDALIGAISGGVYPCIVASRKAIGTGVDGLQYWAHEQLFTYPSSSGNVWEQALGRLHRTGQKAEEVLTWVAVHSKPARSAFKSAVENARFTGDMERNTKKLVYGDMELGLVEL